MKREMFRRNYGVRTIKSYAFCLDKFLRWCGNEPRRITKADVKQYLEYLCERNKSRPKLAKARWTACERRKA